MTFPQTDGIDFILDWLNIIGTICFSIACIIFLCEYAKFYLVRTIALIRIQLCSKHRGQWLTKMPKINHHGPSSHDAHDTCCDHHDQHHQDKVKTHHHHDGSCCH